jgi:hypothetical protein
VEEKLPTISVPAFLAMSVLMIFSIMITLFRIDDGSR